MSAAVVSRGGSGRQTRPADFETVSEPHSVFFSASCSSHFHEIPKIKSTQLTLRYFQAFPGNVKNYVGSAGSTLFWEFLEMRRNKIRKKCGMGPRKKVLESAGLVGISGPSFARDPIFKSG